MQNGNYFTFQLVLARRASISIETKQYIDILSVGH